MLTSEQDPLDLNLVSNSDLSDLDLELILGERATGLNTEQSEVTVGGEKIGYDGLIIATGARARKLSKFDHIDGIHTLRTVDDALAIRLGLISSSSIVIVGAGFIGSEVAAAARQRGCKVTIVEANEAPLVRGLGIKVGNACANLHYSNDIDLRFGVGVKDVHGSSSIEAVALTDGTVLPAELLVVGIGAVPNTEWLAGSGLSVDDGVVCDETLNAGIRGVYAVGDVARAPNKWLGGQIRRTEHWTTATEHAALAAKNLLTPEESAPYSSVPFIWSDQNDHRIQVAGDTIDFDDVQILSGSVEEQSFIAGYRHGNSLAGVMALNNMPRFVKYRRLLAGHSSWQDAVDLSLELTT
tara:strand:+ start:687 stop:1748 length:1062 start_codon:yes stop_codon:yes gene_type:complete